MIWRKGKVPQEWRYAQGVWIPKDKNASNIKLFKTIFVLLVLLYQIAHGIPFFEQLHRHLCAKGKGPSARGFSLWTGQVFPENLRPG